MRLAPIATVVLALVLAGRGVAAQGATSLTVSPEPVARSFKADWHMGRARDLRHAGRLDESLVQLDSVLLADPGARGAHTMRALVLAEKKDQPGTLAALRRARSTGDTLAFPAAMQVATGQYREASLTKKPADYARALETLQLADTLAPSKERRAVPRLLVAATALSMASGELSVPGATAGCPTLDTARGHVRLALASLEGTAGAPPAQVAQVRGALMAFSAYTELQARQLRCVVADPSKSI